ncbi:MAG: DnaJ domain-containing protein [Candidatus Omnitrophica bacterium]|nr:DnaJ domain-containing protein [Candidatus Omnitrophota bacterium]
MAKKIGFEQIDQARKILDLDESATLKEIKEAYRHLASKYHPDRCRKSKLKICERKIREINHAKDILLGYCSNYRYSFKERDAMRNSFEEEEYAYLKRFYDGWIVEL